MSKILVVGELAEKVKATLDGTGHSVSVKGQNDAISSLQAEHDQIVVVASNDVHADKTVAAIHSIVMGAPIIAVSNSDEIAAMMKIAGASWAVFNAMDRETLLADINEAAMGLH